MVFREYQQNKPKTNFFWVGSILVQELARLYFLHICWGRECARHVIRGGYVMMLCVLIGCQLVQYNFCKLNECQTLSSSFCNIDSSKYFWFQGLPVAAMVMGSSLRKFPFILHRRKSLQKIHKMKGLKNFIFNCHVEEKGVSQKCLIKIWQLLFQW